MIGCSMFVPTRETVSVMTNQPHAEIYANGELVGRGRRAEFSAKRNKYTDIMVLADGYEPYYKSIGPELSITGGLDLIGCFIWLVPFIGMFFPGSKSLDTTSVTSHLIKKEDNVLRKE